MNNSTTQPAETNEQVKIHEAAAQAHEEAARESFDRCDTDGFLSQWAHGISARKESLQALIVKQGGKTSFPALFNLAGQRVKAKLLSLPNRFAPWKNESVWRVETAAGVKWVKAFPVRESTMAKKGYREGDELAPAKAEIVGGGKGMAGAASCSVAAVRTDDGYPPEAVLG